MINGIDISFAQPSVNYNELAAAGVKFVIIRAGISESADSRVVQHVNGCRAAGIPYGFYWYSHAENVTEARREAAACVNVISNFNRPEYPVFFDAEENYIANAAGRQGMTDIALAFIGAIEESGYPSGLYANPDWIENRYDKQRIVGKVDIWLANWTYDPNVESRYQYGQTMWQWGTRCIGDLLVDADICFVDYPKKTAAWYADFNKGDIYKTALEVIRGEWGSGLERKERLEAAGYDYYEIQSEVNRILALGTKKTIEEIAAEVIRGEWGSGLERIERIEAAGYDYREVQNKVNEILNG